MMDDATEPDHLTPALFGAEADAPMHYLFEIQLITNQVVGKASAENRSDNAWKVKAQHIRRYLVNYYRDHATLPMGRCYLGMTRPHNLEVGMIDFGVIRQRIRSESEKRNGAHRGAGDNDYATEQAMHSEIAAGTREQNEGQAPEQVVFDLRHALTRRGKKAQAGE